MSTSELITLILIVQAWAWRPFPELEQDRSHQGTWPESVGVKFSEETSCAIARKRKTGHYTGDILSSHPRLLWHSWQTFCMELDGLSCFPGNVLISSLMNSFLCQDLLCAQELGKGDQGDMTSAHLHFTNNFSNKPSGGEYHRGNTHMFCKCRIRRVFLSVGSLKEAFMRQHWCYCWKEEQDLTRWERDGEHFRERQ